MTRRLCLLKATICGYSWRPNVPNLSHGAGSSTAGPTPEPGPEDCQRARAGGIVTVPNFNAGSSSTASWDQAEWAFRWHGGFWPVAVRSPDSTGRRSLRRVVQTEPRPQVRAARGFAEVARRAWPKSPPNAASPQPQPAAERAAADSSGSGNNCEHMRTPPETRRDWDHGGPPCLEFDYYLFNICGLLVGPLGKEA